ncbi:bifunctional DNA primase/polymerase [Microlunatus parietis]|uniref:Primase C terminal 1 (PriCT-1) n=1 Tax=Microlunatus parietis TaxID=682979 RepID=A0A7Y9I8E2_9ACTN|nr:bifunctional DNA primase/polymerase [Microlunatus parietis]NYE72112.1 hypothetical protein [Microlunatus parietis]
MSEAASLPLSAAARAFAGAGVPVFPCVPGGKQPLVEHGFHDATTTPEMVDGWWRRWPSANIGIPTGTVSGVVVIDVDVHGPANGFAAFERAEYAGLVDGWQVIVNSPSGGMHAYYPATPSAVQSCWQAARAGVDFRGDGGYVVVPPSAVHSNGASVPYRVRRINPGPASTLDSDRLRDFLNPRPELRPRPAPGIGREADRSADAARLVAWVAQRPVGERNHGLFWAACRLAENGMRPSDALDALSAAAEKSGLGEREIAVTVRSAYRTARAHPRRSPSRAEARGSSPLAADGWFSRNPSTRCEPRVREL